MSFDCEMCMVYVFMRGHAQIELNPFKMTRTNREPFHVCSDMCSDYVFRPWSLGRQGTIVDVDVSDTCVS